MRLVDFKSLEDRAAPAISKSPLRKSRNTMSAAINSAYGSRSIEKMSLEKSLRGTRTVKPGMMANKVSNAVMQREGRLPIHAGVVVRLVQCEQIELHHSRRRQTGG